MLVTKPNELTVSYEDEPAVKKVLFLMQVNVGKENAVTSKTILFELEINKLKISHRKLRSIIRHLRRQGNPICSQGGVGYWWPRNMNEVVAVADLELKAKAMDLMETRKAIINGAIILFSGQSELL